MTRYMGIDGGGTSLRVIIVDDALNILVQKQNEGVNPSEIGHALAAARIQAAVADALDSRPGQIDACALGIAGAADSHSSQWLTETIQAILPETLIVPSSDLEIALVGAHGQRHGILLLAGTGSAALGIDQYGGRALIGGWGYLIDDLGSGYWIGSQALQHVVQMIDGRRPPDQLSTIILDRIACANRAELIQWLYHGETKTVSKVAALAETVLTAAEAENETAAAILDQAANHLLEMVIALRQQLDKHNFLEVRFAGGLLQNRNALSDRVCVRLGVTTYPIALYSPVMGAALLAKLHHQSDQKS